MSDQVIIIGAIVLLLVGFFVMLVITIKHKRIDKEYNKLDKAIVDTYFHNDSKFYDVKFQRSLLLRNEIIFSGDPLTYRTKKRIIKLYAGLVLLSKMESVYEIRSKYTLGFNEMCTQWNLPSEITKWSETQLDFIKGKNIQKQISERNEILEVNRKYKNRVEDYPLRNKFVETCFGKAISTFEDKLYVLNHLEELDKYINDKSNEKRQSLSSQYPNGYAFYKDEIKVDSQLFSYENLIIEKQKEFDETKKFKEKYKYGWEEFVKLVKSEDILKFKNEIIDLDKDLRKRQTIKNIFESKTKDEQQEWAKIQNVFSKNHPVRPRYIVDKFRRRRRITTRWWIMGRFRFRIDGTVNYGGKGFSCDGVDNDNWPYYYHVFADECCFDNSISYNGFERLKKNRFIKYKIQKGEWEFKYAAMQALREYITKLERISQEEYTFIVFLPHNNSIEKEAEKKYFGYIIKMLKESNIRCVVGDFRAIHNIKSKLAVVVFDLITTPSRQGYIVEQILKQSLQIPIISMVSILKIFDRKNADYLVKKESSRKGNELSQDYEEDEVEDNYYDSIDEENLIMRSLSGHGCDPELFGF